MKMLLLSLLSFSVAAVAQVRRPSPLLASPYDVVLPILNGDPMGSDRVSGQMYLDALTNSYKAIDKNGEINTFAMAGSVVNSVTAGNGLIGSGTIGNVTLDVNVGYGPNQIVQLDGTGKLPAVDGSQLLNLPAGNSSSGALGELQFSDGSGGFSSDARLLWDPSTNILSLNSMTIDQSSDGNNTVVMHGKNGFPATITSKQIDASGPDLRIKPGNNTSGDPGMLQIIGADNNYPSNFIGGGYVAIRAGSANASRSSSTGGYVSLTGGNALGTAGVGGHVILTTGSGGGARGNILLADGTEGVVGHVWTSTGTDGTGRWALAPYAPGAPGDWAGTPPATVAEALDRLAALAKALNSGNPIP